MEPTLFKNIDTYRVSQIEPSAFYISEFVSTVEEQSIMSNIYSAPKPKWTQLSNRRLQNWGGIPHVKGMIAEKIPSWLDTYLEKIHQLNLMGGKRPNHVLVNEYSPGQGIMPHLDGSLFYPTITTISLGSHIILKFLEPSDDEDKKSMSHAFSLLLEPRSLLVLQEKLFSYYLHCIEEVTEDLLDDTVVNLNMCSSSYMKGSTVPRATRISLTIRHVPKTSAFKLNIVLSSSVEERQYHGATAARQRPHPPLRVTAPEKKIKKRKQNLLLGMAVRDAPCCELMMDIQGVNGGDLNRYTHPTDMISILKDRRKGLVVGVYEVGQKFDLTPAATEVDQKSGGKLCKHLSELSCELKLGKAFVMTDLLQEYSGVALASLGPKDAGYCKLEQLDQARENTRWGVGAGVAALQERGCTHIAVDAGAAADAAAEAAVLAAWRFQEYKSCGDRAAEAEVSLYGGQGHDQFRWGYVCARAQNWARYMSDMPANNMTPVDLAQEALNVLCPLGVRVEARDREWIEAQNMRAFLTVARGSCETPMFLECEYNGAKDSSPPILIVAKGVTFDSGGLCLKSARSMVENRGSMAGAAVALAAIRIMAELGIPVNVCACIPLCENMISGQCMKVGDVVQALNGLSIQIEHTDMEGRLMMADSLIYGQALFKPSLVIDVATFTHGVLLATGGGAFGCFSNSEAAWRVVQRAGAATGDRPWRFPLWSYYQHQITNEPAVDLRNKGSGKATPCIGAAFLRNFVCGDWVHMDITGVGKVSHGAAPYLAPRRMTGRPARTLALTLQHIAEACAKAGAASGAAKAKARQ